MKSSPATILLVDGDVDTLSVLSRILDHEGYIVETALQLSDALELCHGRTIDLLICAAHLRDAPGSELLAHLRRQCGTRGLALLTAPTPVDIAEAREAGFESHLARPVTAEQLLAAVRETLARPAPLATTPSPAT